MISYEPSSSHQRFSYQTWSPGVFIPQGSEGVTQFQFARPLLIVRKKTIWQYPGILQTNEVALRTLNFPPHTYLIILLPSNQASTSCFPAQPTHQTLGALGCCEWLVTHGECYSQGASWMGWGIRLATPQWQSLAASSTPCFRCANDCQILYVELQRDVLWRAGHTFLFSKNSSLSHSANESEIETAHWKTSLEPTESRDSPEN